MLFFYLSQFGGLLLLSKKSIRLLVYCYLFSIILSQPLYLLNNSDSKSLATIASSSTLWGVVLLIALQGGYWTIKDQVKPEYSNQPVPLRKFLFALTFITFLGISISITRYELGSIQVIDALKVLLSLIIGIQLMKLNFLGENFTFRLIRVFLLSQVIFGLTQYYAIVFNKETGLSIFLVGSEKAWWDSYAVWGSFPNSGKNTFATLLVFSCAILIPIYFNQIKIKSSVTRVSSFLTGLILALTVLALYLSKSRTNLIVFTSILVIELIVLYRSNSKKPLLIFMVLILSTLFTFSYLNYGFLSRNSWVDRWDSLYVRFNIARSVFNSDSLNYLIGTGAGSIFDHTQGSFADNVRSGNLTLGINSDNSYIRTFAETGLVGLFILVSSIIRYPGYVLRTLDNFENKKVLLRSYMYLGWAFLAALASSDLISNTTLIAYFVLLIGCLASNPGIPSSRIANQQSENPVR